MGVTYVFVCLCELTCKHYRFDFQFFHYKDLGFEFQFDISGFFYLLHRFVNYYNKNMNCILASMDIKIHNKDYANNEKQLSNSRIVLLDALIII